MCLRELENISISSEKFVCLSGLDLLSSFQCLPGRSVWRAEQEQEIGAMPDVIAAEA
jgi:hypothetical protein